MAAVTKLLNSLAITEKPTYVCRLSDEPNSPLKVFFKLEKSRNLVLSKATSLRRNRAYDGVYIVPDLTKLQRERDFRLREKLRDLKVKHPNKHYTIRNGQIKEAAPENPIDNNTKKPTNPGGLGRIGSSPNGTPRRDGPPKRTTPVGSLAVQFSPPLGPVLKLQLNHHLQTVRLAKALRLSIKLDIAQLLKYT